MDVQIFAGSFSDAICKNAVCEIANCENIENA